MQHEYHGQSVWLDLREAHRLDSAMVELANIVAVEPNVGKIFEQFMLSVKMWVGFDQGAIISIDLREETCTIAYHVPPVKQAWGSLLAQEATASGDTVIPQEAALDSSGVQGSEESNDTLFCSTISTPIVFQGKLVGSLILFHNRPDAYGPKEREILEHFAWQIGPVLQASQLEGRLISAKQALDSETQAKPGDPRRPYNPEESSRPGASVGLSRRQSDVLKLLGQGCSNNQIAEALNIKLNTVKTHVRALITKFGASNRTQLALTGLKILSETPAAKK